LGESPFIAFVEEFVGETHINRVRIERRQRLTQLFGDFLEALFQLVVFRLPCLHLAFFLLSKEIADLFTKFIL
jgi:ribonuclease P protein component